MNAVAEDVAVRARLSLGRSATAIHETVAALLAARGASGVLADIGCGQGDLWRVAGTRFDACIGVDAARYPTLPDAVAFRACDLDRDPLPVETAAADVAAAIEVIEHLENPRAFCRELSRITKPGGWIVLTTPNQLSALSVLSLAVFGQFAAFRERDYPAHRTALVPIDLQRIAAECGWPDVAVVFTLHGRVPFTSRHYPRLLARCAPKRCSDNVVLVARR
jgi:2-polyprenyl-3-methyl-5-hydroxy-6-metoxy-1,4-benzoquinol methylase